MTEIIHYCAPAVWHSSPEEVRAGWVLVREEVTRIPGTDWTTRPPTESPEIIAYRNEGEHTWYKGAPPGWNVTIQENRKEDLEEPEAIGLLLMARKE